MLGYPHAHDRPRQASMDGPGPGNVAVAEQSGAVPVGRDGGVPYPLIALAALAPVLLVSGLVGALARRRR